MTGQAAVGYEDVVAARRALQGVARRTPVIESTLLSAISGGPVWLKCENLQRSGSFKIRGAYWRLSRLTAQERAAGVIAASAGNHAQGVALAAALLGIRATVVMPQDAPLPKVAATRAYGADVVLHGAGLADALDRATELAERGGATFIHPFEHPDVIAGQGTVGLEIAEQCPGARSVVVPVGGGGLIAGVATALHGAGAGSGSAGDGPAGDGPAGIHDAAVHQAVPPEVIGVQAEAISPFPASLAAGRPVGVTPAPTMADGIAVTVPGTVSFSLIRRLVGRVLTVTEEGLSRALLTCLERAKLLVEPAGAAGVAALIEHAGQIEPPVVVLLSGGNIDPLLLSKVLRHGLAAAGRYLALRCRIPDRPGSLAELLAALAALGANVLDVMHERVSAGLRVDEVEVILQVEARGPGHREEIVTALAGYGYRARVI